MQHSNVPLQLYKNKVIEGPLVGPSIHLKTLRQMPIILHIAFRVFIQKFKPCIIDSPKPKNCNDLQIKGHSMESNAFSKSSKMRISASLHLSIRSHISRIHSPMYLPFLNPVWISLIISFKTFLILCAMLGEQIV